MEIYTLDSNLNEEYVVEGYKSAIWTERYNDNGDFQIIIPATDYNRNLLAVDTFLSQKSSTYVMQVKTMTDATADDGSDTLTITGKSLEGTFLDDRVAMPFASVNDFSVNPKWVLTNTPGNIIREMFQAICVDCVLDPGDFLPFYQNGTFLPSGTIAETPEIVTISMDPASLYSSISQIAQNYDLGFRIVRDRSTVPATLYFEVYTGDDRTSAQTVNSPVIFGPDMDNLTDTTRLISTANHKTIAYVFGRDKAQVVYGVGEDTGPTGFSRHVIVVSASSVDSTSVTDVEAALGQAGLSSLSANQKVYQFDGKISEYGLFQYGRDYKLGDLVEQRDQTGYGRQMRVTEQIFASDDQGDRQYPTLSLTETLVPGTWSDVVITEHWADEDNNEFWANQ